MLEVLAAVLLASPAADAQGLDGEMVKLAKLIEARDWQAAAPVARWIEARIAAQAPLEVYDGQVLGRPGVDRGIYEPLPNSEVTGAEMIFYAQIRNHQQKRIVSHLFQKVERLILMPEQRVKARQVVQHT